VRSRSASNGVSPEAAAAAAVGEEGDEGDVPPARSTAGAVPAVDGDGVVASTGGGFGRRGPRRRRLAAAAEQAAAGMEGEGAERMGEKRGATVERMAVTGLSCAQPTARGTPIRAGRGDGVGGGGSTGVMGTRCDL
jgi:hypothetical protein